MATELAEHLRGVDKLCDRWAKERRDRAPSLKCTLHNMALTRAGVVLEGPLEMSEDSLLIDRIYLSAPDYERNILAVWYCDNSPVIIKAKKLNISKANIYSCWKATLSYVRGRLHEIGKQV